MNKPMAVDPFFAAEGEHTVFALPTPGGRSSAPRRAERSSEPADDALPEPAPCAVGLNPLVAAAHPLLALVPRIRATAQLGDPMALKESLAQGLREFEARARAAGIAPERALAARYILCTALDEAAGSTPWGGSGQWARHNLLVAFHNENAGGGKVFELMARLAEQPADNRDLLELVYAALCLGFEGRFGAAEGGRAQLEAVRERLAGILHKVRGDHAPALAQHWRGQATRRRALLSWLPLWVSGSLAALLLLGVYVALAFSLDARSDPVFERIQALRLGTPPVPAAARPAPRPRLAQLLQPEIGTGALSVREELDRSVVTLRGDGMFEPGSAALSPAQEGLLRRVAQAVGQIDGEVLVTGHTDSRPIRSLRYPSNWQLSQERAGAVRALLVAAGLGATRVRAEGRAAGEPLAGNDTPEQRALNRRIEVIVYAGRAQAPAGGSS